MKANRAMDRITMPSALLSRILLSQDPRQKQVVIRHRGRSPNFKRQSPMQTEEQPHKGVIARSYESGLPVIWAFADVPPLQSTREALPWLTVISWRYDDSSRNGMPPKPLNERMIALEDAIEGAVVRSGFCEHAISRTGNQLKELVYYINDRDTFLARFNDALRDHERYPIAITFYHDPEWLEHAHARDMLDRSDGHSTAPARPEHDHAS